MFGKGKNKIKVVEKKLYEVGIFGPPYYAWHHCTTFRPQLHGASHKKNITRKTEHGQHKI